MAYKTKDGTSIPSQFDLLVLPLIESFDAITFAHSVAELRQRIQKIKVPQETDRFAHLRLRGSWEHLGRLIERATSAGACAEFLELLTRLRLALARSHDALPVDPEFPRARLADDAPKAAWARPPSETASAPEPTAAIPTEEVYRLLLEE